MTLLFCQIQQLTTELACLEFLKINISTFVSVAIDLTLFKLADKEEMHNILDVFEFWPDWTTDNRGTCSCLGYPKIHLHGGELFKVFYDLLARGLGYLFNFINICCIQQHLKRKGYAKISQ